MLAVYAHIKIRRSLNSQRNQRLALRARDLQCLGEKPCDSVVFCGVLAMVLAFLADKCRTADKKEPVLTGRAAKT
ncbi:hypothetical protein [Crenobacter intestini]|uniref:Uncharacterized protein n=1 Tax=Crenobacter intestini TaxID=2563443 RepID=A0A4T0UKP3_9NEIS|nr:hypothetical protein [Crenobacter intestini]TIC78745.1 hypothetical protein E5K04_15175 [Crenobacter intestini]